MPLFSVSVGGDEPDFGGYQIASRDGLITEKHLLQTQENSVCSTCIDQPLLAKVLQYFSSSSFLWLKNLPLFE